MENSKGKVLRIVGVGAVVALLVAVIIASMVYKPSVGGQAWDLATTQGSENAKRHYIMYTDIACPYCDVFSRAIMEHQEEFDQFLAENSVLFEVRLTDTLYYGAGLEMSRDSAEATYCAKREGKFWDYYHQAIQSLWEDYHSKGIGNNKAATPIKDMPANYWLKIGEKVGLGNSFAKCVNEHETAREVEENTYKSSQVAQGMPTFKFGNFYNAGFNDAWGWEEVLMYLNAGL